MSNATIGLGEFMPSAAATVQGTAAASVSLVIPASNAGAKCLTSVTVSYTGANSGNVLLSVWDGATAVWTVDISVTVGTPQTWTFPGGGLSVTPGNALMVALSAGAASSVGRISATHYTQA